MFSCVVTLKIAAESGSPWRVQYMVELLVIDPALDQAIDLFDGLFNWPLLSLGGRKGAFMVTMVRDGHILQSAVREKE